MNENCKYCKTSKTCLENADYGSIYCQLHKKIPKVIGKTYDELQQENQQLKEQLQQKEDVINKAIKFVKDYKTEWTLNDEVLNDMDKLVEILDNKGE